VDGNIVETCDACQRHLPPDARFCPGCGAPVRRAAREGLEPELRILTLAFCDVVGSTELSSRVDPEDYGELIHDYHQRVAKVAQRFGGRIGHLSGDGLLVHFGWPRAHDDDPERAVRAGIAIVASMQPTDDDGDHRVRVRVGVHTGPVLVSELTSGDQREITVLGETANLAARLQNVAEPNSVAVSDVTLALVPGLFQTAPLGSQDLKGITRPVTAHRIIRPTGSRNRFDVEPERLTPFVGRQRELDQLRALWHDARAGHARAVLITGEPGVGKSRLVFHLRSELDVGEPRWLESHCSRFTEASAFQTVIDLMEQGLELASDATLSADDARVRMRRIERSLDRLGIAEADAIELLSGLTGLRGLSDSTDGQGDTIDRERAFEPGAIDQRRRRVTGLLREWVLRAARARPLVIVVEDLQWIDPSSLDLIADLLAPADASLLVILTARPEFVPPWSPVDADTDPTADDHRRDHADSTAETLLLAPLDATDAGALVRAATGQTRLPDRLVDRIVADTAGLPLFAEEVGRAVVESGQLTATNGEWIATDDVDRLVLPTTLTSSLMARLDGQGTAKAIAQRASVIGRQFGFDVLVAIADEPPSTVRDGLERLVESELLSRSPATGYDRYAFKHALIQEAAYESLLRRVRRPLHRRIAEELTERWRLGANVAPEIIARHYEAAGSTSRAAEWFWRAGRDAMRRAGAREALVHLSRAIELIVGLPRSPERDEQEVEIQLARAAVHIGALGYADPAIEAAYSRVRELCAGLDDDDRVAEALAGLSIYSTNRGETDAGIGFADRVMAIARERDDDTLRLLGHIQLAHPLLYQGSFQECRSHAEQAVAIYDPERHRDIAQRFGTDHGVAAHMFAGWSELMLGRPDTALDQLRDSVALAVRLAQPFDIAYARVFKATIHWARGESAEVMDESARAQAIADEHGFVLWRAIATLYHAAEQLRLDGDVTSLAGVLDAQRLAEGTGERAAATVMLARIAEAMVDAHLLDDAQQVVALALEVSADLHQRWWDGELLRMRAEIALARDTSARVAPIRSDLRDALDIARASGSTLHEVRAAAALARLDAGRPQALETLRDALAGCVEGADTPIVTSGWRLVHQLEQVTG
jgi:class 3 adenylate cyclase